MSFDNFASVLSASGDDLLRPWIAFDKAWTSIMGYHPEQFDFVPGVTPLSTWTEVSVVTALYLLVVFGGREFMRNRPPLQLKTLFKVHNLLLTISSGALLVLFAEQLVPSLWRYGLYDNICGASQYTRRLQALYYVNYIVKYIELIDTVFLMVKKKPLTFLHTYHHPATAFLCFTQLLGTTSVQWVPITLNLTVHVVMYWYYFQSARGIRIWWKEWITRLQIIQFVLDLGFVYFASYQYYAAVHAPWLPYISKCSGNPWAAVAGCSILSSYLVLFIMFYIATYRKASTRKAKSRDTNRNVGMSSMRESAVMVADGCNEIPHSAKAEKFD